MSDPNYIQCRFCSWRTAKWRVNRDGEQKGPSTAFMRLRNHIEDEHPAQYEEIYGAEVAG